MDSWEVNFAKELKKRDNQPKMGAMLGKVISVEPVKISIQDGRFFVTSENGYICNQLLERISSYTLSENGNIDVSCKHGGGSYSLNGSGNVHLDAVWKAGDYVMIVPDGSEQHFFIVDIVRGVA